MRDKPAITGLGRDFKLIPARFAVTRLARFVADLRFCFLQRFLDGASFDLESRVVRDTAPSGYIFKRVASSCGGWWVSGGNWPTLTNSPPFSCHPPGKNICAIRRHRRDYSPFALSRRAAARKSAATVTTSRLHQNRPRRSAPIDKAQ